MFSLRLNEINGGCEKTIFKPFHVRVAQSNGTARSTQKQCVELYGHKGFDTSTMANPLRFE